MEGWNFLSKHGRVLLCIARDPGVRLRDIAASVGITERSAYGIVTDLTAAGYAVKQKDGRRNRYQIQAHLPPHEPTSQQLAIGEVLALLAGATVGQTAARGNLPEAAAAAGAPPSPEGSRHDDDRTPRTRGA
jgi:predicted DNA-binding transcriptional regulator YafY